MLRNQAHAWAAGLLASALATMAALAQTPVQPPRAPNMPGTETTIPDIIRPEEPGTTGSTNSGRTLSEKLEATEGVIRPPSNIDPGITMPAPVPNPRTTPVIPPPGSPGGNQDIQPR